VIRACVVLILRVCLRIHAIEIARAPRIIQAERDTVVFPDIRFVRAWISSAPMPLRAVK
jgi:hypothetical protein